MSKVLTKEQVKEVIHAYNEIIKIVKSSDEIKEEQPKASQSKK